MAMWAMVCQDDPAPADGSDGPSCASWALINPGYLAQDAVVFIAPAGTSGDYSTNKWYAVRNIPSDASLEVATVAGGGGWGTTPVAGAFGIAPGGCSDSFDVSMLNSADLAAAWSAGFVVVAVSWAIGWGFRALLSMIRR